MFVIIFVNTEAYLADFSNVKNCLNTNIDSYKETSDGQSSNLSLIVVRFSTPVSIRLLWQLMTVVFPNLFACRGL
jgi:hypothetical protein